MICPKIILLAHIVKKLELLYLKPKMIFLNTEWGSVDLIKNIGV